MGSEGRKIREWGRGQGSREPGRPGGLARLRPSPSALAPGLAVWFEARESGGRRAHESPRLLETLRSSGKRVRPMAEIWVPALALLRTGCVLHDFGQINPFLQAHFPFCKMQGFVHLFVLITAKSPGTTPFCDSLASTEQAHHTPGPMVSGDLRVLAIPIFLPLTLHAFLPADYQSRTPTAGPYHPTLT